jgi:hypothetical protein
VQSPSSTHSIHGQDAADMVRLLVDAAAGGGSAAAFHRADLRGLDLAGRSLACLSLRGAVLDGADLSGASLEHVDLLGASLRGVDLRRASLSCVGARGACFADARLDEAFAEHVDLTGADLSRASLRNALLRVCTLTRADLGGVDLTEGRLVGCECTDTGFRDALFEEASATDSTFDRAEFAGAKRFFLCREIVVELLKRELGDDLERTMLVGALAIERGWCYAEWARILAERPGARRAAVEAFRRYPASGCAEALQAECRSSQARPGGKAT